MIYDISYLIYDVWCIILLYNIWEDIIYDISHDISFNTSYNISYNKPYDISCHVIYRIYDISYHI